jgi:hypothetical protein
MAEAEFNYTPAFKAAWERIQERIKQEIAIAVDKLGAEDPETMDAIISSVFREEMQKLGQIERIKNLYKIRDKHTQQFTQFVPNKHQLDVLEGGRSRVAILKSRQVGYTTFACVYALDKALFEYWNTGIMSHSQKHVAKIFDIVRHTYSYFVRDWGDYYKPQEAFNNANELAWEDTKASVSVAMDFQGRTVKLLHCSEAHFIPTDRPSPILGKSFLKLLQMVGVDTSSRCGRIMRSMETRQPIRGSSFLGSNIILRIQKNLFLLQTLNGMRMN